MSVRCIHLDMKSLFPTADYLIVFLEKLAEAGYTHILLEFEDRFPYEKFPDFVRKSAYSKAEFRAVAEKCRSLGIGIIPLLQCAGHLDYFLKEDACRHLRENGSTYQWCFSDPESFEVWKSMAEEILEVFPDCGYFHIGADEVRLKEPCPRCREHDAFKLYLERVRQCAGFAASKGKKVLMWDDMFRSRDLADFAGLLAVVTPCVWQYREIDREIIRKYAENGIRYWGASRIQSNATIYRGMGRQFMMQKNVDDWAEIEKIYPSDGHIGTVWGRVQSFYPINTTIVQAIYMAAYQNHSLKHGVITDRRDFNRKFAAGFFGAPELDMDLLITWFGIEPQLVKDELVKFLNKVPRNNDILEIWYMFNEIDLLFAYVDQCFGHDLAAKPKFSRGLVTRSQLDNWADGVKIIRERTAALQEELRRVFAKYFAAAEIEEFIEERFSAMLEQNEQWGKFFDTVSAMPHV